MFFDIPAIHEVQARVVASSPDEAARHQFERLRASVLLDMPMPETLASRELIAMIHARTGRYVDPHRLFLHHFGNHARSSSQRSVNGWQHSSAPLESHTLIDAVLRNFSPRDMEQDDDTLRAQSGIYTTGPGALAYGPESHNEFPLTAVDLRDFTIGFYDRYTRQLNDFWATHAKDARALAKMQFLNEVRMALVRGELGHDDYRTLMGGGAPLSSLDASLSMDDVRRVASPSRWVAVKPLRIEKYASTDIRVFTNPARRVVLYVPGASRPLHGFRDEDEMRWWLGDHLADPAILAEIRTHFSLSDQQDGLFYDGVSTALERLATRERRARDPAHVDLGSVIPGDIFSDITAQREARSRSDGKILIRSSGEVLKRRWMGYLSVVTKLVGPAAVMDTWPLTLTGAAWLSQMALHADALVSGNTLAERREGLRGMVGDIATAVAFPVFCRLVGFPEALPWEDGEAASFVIDDAQAITTTGDQRLADVIRQRSAQRGHASETDQDTFVSAMASMSSSSVAEELPAILDYVENGADEVNGLLRSGRRSELTDIFLAEFGTLSDYDGMAYRAARVTAAGKQALMAGKGAYFRDMGVQSASTTVVNLNGWARLWANSQGVALAGDTHPVIFVFDDGVPMKNLSTGLLPDHVAVAPGTTLRLAAVRREDDTIYAYMEAATEYAGTVFDLYDGQPGP